MKDKHEGTVRGFHSLNRAWYAKKDGLPEVMIGLYDPDGGTSGEFAIRWKNLDNRLVPQLQVFDDAWDALTKFKDLLDKLAEIDNTNIQEMELCNLLEDLGIEDLTDYKMKRR